jgi:hypothetical protein
MTCMSTTSPKSKVHSKKNRRGSNRYRMYPQRKPTNFPSLVQFKTKSGTLKKAKRWTTYYFRRSKGHPYVHVAGVDDLRRGGREDLLEAPLRLSAVTLRAARQANANAQHEHRGAERARRTRQRTFRAHLRRGLRKNVEQTSGPWIMDTKNRKIQAIRGEKSVFTTQTIDVKVVFSGVRNL